jgi:cytochrome c-type biogenesis protein CcmH/NrfF
MTKARSRIAIGVLLGFATLPLLLAPAGAERVSDRAKQIGMKLKCMCGSCDMTAGGCSHPGGEFSGPCQAWALPALLQVDNLLAQGKTEQQILDSFVAQYGPVIYAEPPKSGFSLVAWAMPTVYLVVGAALVVFVISRWRRRPATEAGPAGSAPKPISPELLERARAQAARETED